MTHHQKICRYKPEGLNLFKGGYSGFRNGITFGEKKLAQKFIKKIKKQGLYKKLRIMKVCG